MRPISRPQRRQGTTPTGTVRAVFLTKALTQTAPRVLAAAALLVAAACGSDDADKSDAASDIDDVVGAEGANKSGSGGGIAWEECGAKGECAQFEVPLDHSNPSGEKLTLGITRIPAEGERAGALFVNPGGPGATVDEVPANLASRLPAEVTEQFDIVALDPRGVGEENLVDCGYDWAELYGVDATIDSPEDEAELLATSEAYVDSCSSAVGDDVLQHMGTRDVARDMDLARQAIGDEQISYLGFSFGTVIGQVYADLFPDKVRAMVLDGVAEFGKPGVETAGDQAAGFESALQAFAADCDANGECTLAPDTLAQVDALIAAVEDEPIPAEPRDLGPGELALALAMPLYSDVMWPNLAQGVLAANNGDGTLMMQLADQYLDLANFDVYFGVNCLDWSWTDSPEEHLAEAASISETAPRFGEAIVNDYIRCAMWPVEGEPLEPVTAPGTPPILVVATTNDPATPYQAGVNAAETLEQGVLLTFEGDQHLAVAYGNDCIDSAVATYLVTLETPAEGTTC